MTYSLHQHERKAPRPVYKEAQVYYNDFNAEKRSKKFTQKTHDFNFICKATNPNIPITRKEQDLLADISNIIKASSRGLAYLSHTELSNLTGNNKRQNNIMRKNLSHVLRSKWKKKVKIDGAVMSKVIIFKYTANGEVILNNPREYYEKVKAGTRVPISIYKDEKDIKDRSSVQAHESNFLQNSKKVIVKKAVLANTRKKTTNQERKARIYTPKFKQYDKPKSLSEHYPLTNEECSELQNSSGRPFTLNAMNEILLDISRKPKESTHLFPSKAAFMAYMGKLYRYEGRDAVKTANSGFKIIVRATKAEIIAYTSQNQRDEFMATFEQVAINCPTPENRFKAKIACTLPPMIGYELLSSIKSVSFSSNTLEIHLANQLNIDHYKQAILKEAMAVDCKITTLSVCCG